MAAQVPAIAANEILRLLMEKGLIHQGEAAACLRGIANDVVAYGYLAGLGGAGRSYARALIDEADKLRLSAEESAQPQLSPPDGRPKA